MSFLSVNFDPIITCKDCKAQMQRSGWNAVSDRVIIFQCGSSFLIDQDEWFTCETISAGGVFFEYSHNQLHMEPLGTK